MHIFIYLSAKRNDTTILAKQNKWATLDATTKSPVNGKKRGEREKKAKTTTTSK